MISKDQVYYFGTSFVSTQQLFLPSLQEGGELVTFCVPDGRDLGAANGLCTRIGWELDSFVSSKFSKTPSISYPLGMVQASKPTIRFASEALSE